MGNGTLEGLRGVFRVCLAVGFVGFDEGVCGVVGFIELLGLDCSGAEESVACFFACMKMDVLSFQTAPCFYEIE